MSRFNGKRAEFEASGEKINVAILGAGRIAHTGRHPDPDG